MAYAEWSRVPVGIDASQWVTRGECRTVLAVVHTVTSGQRLLETVELIEEDMRVQVVFTQAPDAFSNGVPEFLRMTKAVVLPWEQAIRERFDLAVTASYGGLHLLHAPILVLPHGAGYGKAYQTDSAPLTYGLDAQRLLHNGRVLPSALVLSHADQLDVLRRQCPQAVDNAVVAGDPCYDRMVASLPRRDAYRTALGIEPDGELVVVSSTWGRDSLLARCDDLLPRLLEEFGPRGGRVAALLHPAVWFGHGPRQVEAWLAECRDAGLILVGPHVDWRATVIAADHVVTDHGSVGVYAAAVGKSVLLADLPLKAVTSTGSPQDLLRAEAPMLLLNNPLREQFDAARSRTGRLRDAISGRLTSRPGRSTAELRQAVYRLLNLPPPGRHRAVAPVALSAREVL